MHPYTSIIKFNCSFKTLNCLFLDGRSGKVGRDWGKGRRTKDELAAQVARHFIMPPNHLTHLRVVQILFTLRVPACHPLATAISIAIRHTSWSNPFKCRSHSWRRRRRDRDGDGGTAGKRETGIKVAKGTGRRVDGVLGSFACMQRRSWRGNEEMWKWGWCTSEDKEFGKSQLSVRLHVENLSSSCLAHKNGVKHRILPRRKVEGSAVEMNGSDGRKEVLKERTQDSQLRTMEY